jgi:hypothetical protein
MSFKINKDGEIVIDRETLMAAGRLCGAVLASQGYTSGDEVMQKYLADLRTEAEQLCQKLQNT